MDSSKLRAQEKLFTSIPSIEEDIKSLVNLQKTYIDLRNKCQKQILEYSRENIKSLEELEDLISFINSNNVTQSDVYITNDPLDTPVYVSLPEPSDDEVIYIINFISAFPDEQFIVDLLKIIYPDINYCGGDSSSNGNTTVYAYSTKSKY